jgi:putative tricarboxylic transport membrane protein
MNRDLVFGSAAFALAVGYYLMAAMIPASLLADAVGPQGLPKTYAVLLAGLSLALIVRSLASRSARQVRPKPDSTVSPDQGSALWRVAGLLAIGAAYVVVVPWLGYMLSLASLIMATTYYQGGAWNRQVAAVAVSGAIVFWLLFVMLLGIPQPAGFWPSLL